MTAYELFGRNKFGTPGQVSSLTNVVMEIKREDSGTNEDLETEEKYMTNVWEDFIHICSFQTIHKLSYKDL
jgi:hypothetical protein